jgi:EAL domain-containing protein (putative c-di-GMP-specific phosphodiesterase class I)
MIEKSFEFFKNRENSFSINLSFEDILNTQLVDYIKQKLDETGMNRQLILEILESESIDNFQLVKEFISQMKNLGVRIAIDDFGSGYSNFSYLLELMPDYIKIDGSLIKEIDSNEKSQAIVKSITNFAKDLGIMTIGEFIHSKEVHDKAKEFGIYGFQGYYLGMPKDTIA